MRQNYFFLWALLSFLAAFPLSPVPRFQSPFPVTAVPKPIRDTTDTLQLQVSSPGDRPATQHRSTRTVKTPPAGRLPQRTTFFDLHQTLFHPVDGRRTRRHCAATKTSRIAVLYHTTGTWSRKLHKAVLGQRAISGTTIAGVEAQIRHKNNPSTPPWQSRPLSRNQTQPFV